MRLIGEFRSSGYLALAEAVEAFFDRRADLQRPGIPFQHIQFGGGSNFCIECVATKTA